MIQRLSFLIFSLMGSLTFLLIFLHQFIQLRKGLLKRLVSKIVHRTSLFKECFHTAMHRTTPSTFTIDTEIVFDIIISLIPLQSFYDCILHFFREYPTIKVFWIIYKVVTNMQRVIFQRMTYQYFILEEVIKLWYIINIICGHGL